MEQQITMCVKATGQFEESMRLVVAAVQSVVNDINNLHSQTVQDSNNNATLTFSDTASPEKAKSLVRMKQEKAERKLMRQRAKIEYSTLPDFIRYVDYLALEVFVALAISSVEAFHEEFAKARKTGIFETTVRFNNMGATFSPTCNEIKEMLDNLLEALINTVGGVNRVCYIPIRGTQPAPQSVTSIQTVIHENKHFREMADLIRQRLVTDFDKADEHAQTYESIRPIYDFNENWDLDRYRSQQHDVASLKSMMELITNWNKELEKLRNKSIGVLEVDSRRLKGELNPLRDKRLQEIKDHIKDIARSVIDCNDKLLIIIY